MKGNKNYGDEKMNIKYYPLNHLGTNCYFVYDKEKAVIIDPSGEPEIIFEEIENLNVKVIAVFLTHAHWDHILALDEVVTKYNVNVYMGRNEEDWLKEPTKNLSVRASEEIGHLVYDIEPIILDEGEHKIDGIAFSVLETPGHSPGSLSYVFDGYIVSGDVLFNGGIGRTDLPGSNHPDLITSITEKLFKLPDDTVVYPGHGEPTTIGDEKLTNPFFN